MINGYQVTGNTHLVTATSTSSSINITPTEAGRNFAGQGGPIYLKITNGSASENIYFNTGTSNNLLALVGIGSPIFSKFFKLLAFQKYFLFLSI